MKIVDISVQAHRDLETLKEYLQEEFGGNSAKRIIGAIYDDLEKLEIFPKMGVNLFARYGMETEYLCLITHKNYVFYRIEGDYVRIIRVLDERCDFMRILFGIVTTPEETEEYWDE